jgi:hypothetical protein
MLDLALRTLITAWISEWILARHALGLAFSCMAHMRLEQSDSIHVGCRTQSATSRRPSKHAFASVCSVDAHPHITF